MESRPKKLLAPPQHSCAATMLRRDTIRVKHYARNTEQTGQKGNLACLLFSPRR